MSKHPEAKKPRKKPVKVRLPSVVINGVEFRPVVTEDTEVRALAGAYFVLGMRLSMTFKPIEQHTPAGLKGRRANKAKKEV